MCWPNGSSKARSIHKFAGGYAEMGALKMREWKMQEQTAGVENAGVENAGATKYGKPSEENTLKYQMKYGCRGFHAYLLSADQSSAS